MTKIRHRIIAIITLIFLSLASIYYNNVFAGQAWISHSEPGSSNWRSISVSSDGEKVYAFQETGYGWKSTDSGHSWVRMDSAGTRIWSASASSSDGMKIVAMANGGNAWTSNDGGTTWVEQTSSGSRSWVGVAMSTDGSKVVAANNQGYIYTSSDGGVNWVEQTLSAERVWYQVASDSTGTNLVAGLYAGGIYTSNDSGVTWTLQGNAGTGIWRAIAMSSDGSKIVAGDNGGLIHTSTDGGINWTTQESPGTERKWESIVMSPDGQTLVGVSFQYQNGGGLYRSTDGGVTWNIDDNIGTEGWYSLAMSSDGTKIFAGKYAGYIYTFGDYQEPEVTTDSSVPGGVTANLVGSVVSIGDAPVTARGFEYGLTDSYGSSIHHFGGSRTGSYSENITGLDYSTTYHFRAYATNAVGTTYGADQTFTTSAGEPSTLGASATDITRNTALLTARISDIPGGDIISKGFEYGPTSSYGFNVDNATGNFLEPFWFMGKINTNENDEPINTIYGVAVDSQDNIYVANADEKKILKFDASGNFVSSIGEAGEGDGQFDLPIGVFVDQNDNLYVTDSSLNRVQKFSSTGQFLMKFGSAGSENGLFNGPNAGVVDSAGFIYVVDPGNHRVQIFDLDGTFVSKFGSENDYLIYELEAPTGIAIDSHGDIYVVDSFNYRVEKFDSSGNPISMLGYGGEGPGEFEYPNGIDIDSNGNIFVSSRNKIQKFDSNGLYVAEFGSYGDQDGQFMDPWDVAINSEGDIYVSDFLNMRIQKFSGSGLYDGTIKDLVCGTIYHYREYVTSSLSTGYGEDKMFSTLDCASFGRILLPVHDKAKEEKEKQDKEIKDKEEKERQDKEDQDKKNNEQNKKEVIFGVTSNPSSAGSVPVALINTTEPVVVNNTEISANNPDTVSEKSSSDGIVSVVVKNTVLGLTETKKITKEFIETLTGQVVTQVVPVVGAVSGAGVSVVAGIFANPLTMSEIFLIPMRLWALLMAALGLKKRNRPWGTVYDSVTKQPLDPAYVVLYDSAGKEIATSITDLDGRYGFLVGPGTYHIIASKTNYTFPSAKLKGKTIDELYNNIYFGNEIVVTTDGQVIAENIPLDAENFDWNEYAKKEQKLTKFYSTRQKLVAYISNALFGVGMLVTIVAVLAAPTNYNIWTLVLYLVLYILKRTILRPKPQGSVIEKVTGSPLPFAVVRIYSTATNREIIHKVTDKVGKYYCLIPNGTYYATVERKNNDSTYTKIYTSESVEVTGGYFKGNFLV
ncbi:MAG: 6-bladed beta-propeller [Minisyncoccia bacterium]